MPTDDKFAALVARVGEFHITERAMKQTQTEAEERIHQGTLDDAIRRRYLQAVRKYFAGFEKEARTHLRDVDRRLEHINQVQFNLNAERGVAVKRIEATQSVLAEVTAMETSNA